MADFLIYDIILLIIFAVFLSIFLYRGRKNLKREGLLLLYKTSWGIKLINKIGKKYKKTLQVLSYVSISLGYLLMAGVLYLVGRIVWIYLTLPEIVKTIKVPPITPLVPYLPQIFQLDFLPPFYFIYWIIIIAIIAITHEIAHGIFAAKNNVEIKKTGFGFFPFFIPIFLAAFVEPDEKEMANKKISKQLAILSAGTFANILTAVLFFFVLFGFLSLAFTPSGVVSDSYPYTPIIIGTVSMVNNINITNPTYENVLQAMEGEGLNSIKTKEGNFLATKTMLEGQKNENGVYVVYYDSPAINSRLESVILKINGVTISNVNKLSEELSKYSPGDKITLNVLGKDGEDYDRDIILGHHPKNGGAWLGLSFSQKDTGILGQSFASLLPLKVKPSDVCSHLSKQSNVCYSPRMGGFSFFIYDLLRWIILVSVSVALINMLPIGMFDGGKYFYLTVLALTKSEKIAKKAFKFSTYLFLLLLVVLLIAWIRSIT